MTYQASRTEEVAIDPFELCSDCPRRGDCQGVAQLAIDTYFKVSFFSMTVPEGDPEAFVSREYVDDKGGKSRMFFEQGESLIQECKGPKSQRQRTARHPFRSAVKECGAHIVVQQAMNKAHAEAERRRAEERATAVYLEPEETQALMALDPAESQTLTALPVSQLNELILFNRNHPDQIDELRQLA
jgi:hypothetical protein